MPTDFLSQIVKQKGKEIAQARKVVSEGRLEEIARRRSDFRSFFEALSRPGTTGVNIIAEIKRASPSKGDIRADLNAALTAGLYEKGGATAISVLTDPTYFKGSLEDLRAARAACRLPVLRKEFIISRYQVYESAAAGADAILLIARVLDPEKLVGLYKLARELGMAVLVEVHTSAEILHASCSGARLVGINNRNLGTFETDTRIAADLVSRLSPGQIPVAASGISGPSDIRENRRAGIFNFLVGESIVRSEDPARFIGELMGVCADGSGVAGGIPSVPL